MGIQAKETDRNWITWILIIGTLLRIFQAFQTIEILHPDEHYQTLEPAARLMWGIGLKTWEWDVGLRSWFTPTLFGPLLFLADGIGRILKTFTERDDSGLIAIYLSRLFVSMTSCFFLLQMHRLLSRLNISKWGQVLVLLCLSLSPEWIVFGSATLTDTLALNALWIGISLAVKWICDVDVLDQQKKIPVQNGSQITLVTSASESTAENPAESKVANSVDWFSVKRFFGIGLLITSPFLFRIQTLAFSLPFLTSLILLNPSSRRIDRLIALVSGSISILIAQGLLDYFTWGHFLHSLRTNISKNLIEGIASHYGVEHWSFYLMESIQSFGIGFSLINLAALLAVLNLSLNSTTLKSLFRSFVKKNTWTLVIFAGSFAYVMVHHLIPHKENRFLLPGLPGFLVFSISILDDLLRRTSETFSKFLNERNSIAKMSQAIAILLLFGITTYSIQRVRSTDLYPSSNMSNLMIHVEQDGGLHQTNDPCILLIRHYWVWTHGELLQHMHYDMFEKNMDNVTQADLDRCPYAVVLPQEHEQFEEKTAGHFVRIDQNPRGYMLYKRTNASPK